MEFTKVASDAFTKLQINAGILAKSFNPATGVVGEIIGATTGGIQFAANPTYEDFGSDVDNVPANTWQLKRITSYDPTFSGTLLTVTAAVARMLSGGADVDGTKITPRGNLVADDFEDAWFIGDYSDNNSGAATAGFVAIHLLKGLNTTGFQIQTSKDEKGQFSFEIHGHYDLTNVDVVPYEIYVKAGVSPSTPSITLNTHAVALGVDDTEQLVASVVPAGSSVTWSSASTTIATVSNGLVTGKTAGNTIITASITSGGVTYNDTCTVVVSA